MEKSSVKSKTYRSVSGTGEFSHKWIGTVLICGTFKKSLIALVNVVIIDQDTVLSNKLFYDRVGKAQLL